MRRVFGGSSCKRFLLCKHSNAGKDKSIVERQKLASFRKKGPEACSRGLAPGRPLFAKRSQLLHCATCVYPRTHTYRADKIALADRLRYRHQSSESTSARSHLFVERNESGSQALRDRDIDRIGRPKRKRWAAR